MFFYGLIVGKDCVEPVSCQDIEDVIKWIIIDKLFLIIKQIRYQPSPTTYSQSSFIHIYVWIIYTYIYIK